MTWAIWRGRNGSAHTPRVAPLPAGLLLGGLLAVALVAPAGAEQIRSEKSALDEQVETAQDEVLAFNHKVAKATRRALDAEDRLPDARANLDRARVAEATAAADHESARGDHRSASRRAISAERRLGRVRKDIDRLAGDVGEFARRAYQLGPFVELEMLLDARDPTDFTDRLEAIRTVSRASNDALIDMNANRADLEHKEHRLRALQDRAAEQKKRARSRLASAQDAARGAQAASDLVNALVSQRRAALRAVRNDRAQIKEQYESLEQEQERVALEIAAAARRLQRRTGVRTGDGGALGGGDWVHPVPGHSIGSPAGYRIHPILGYRRCHTGADIGAPSGTPIRAADHGYVVSAGPNGGYGNFTVITHGGGVTSSYAHQSGIAVSAGQRIERGQVIGFVGSTGLSTGPHLHFEARVDGTPYDARGWLGSGAKVPAC